MSTVSNCILVTQLSDGETDTDPWPNANLLIDWVTKNNFNCSPIAEASAYAGGNKNLECDVFMFAINGLNLDELLAKFKSIPWEYPEGVELFVRGHEEDVFAKYVPDNVVSGVSLNLYMMTNPKPAAGGYAALIVAAECGEVAMGYHPLHLERGNYDKIEDDEWANYSNNGAEIQYSKPELWPHNRWEVKITQIGEALPTQRAGIITSFRS